MAEDVPACLARPAIHRRSLLVGASGAALLGLSARAQVPPPPAKRQGRVIMAISQEPTTFNPLMPGIEVDEGIWLAVFNPLWAVLPDGSLSPQLATEVPSEANGGISEGGLVWKIKLRAGVTWHDGAPFTAEDVKYTLELINAKGFRSRTRQGHELVRDIQISGPLEIGWRMERAYSPYVSLLASTFMVPKHILSQAADPNTAAFNNNPVGTGPFRWDERVPGDHITLAANEKFFGEGPYLEKAIFKYIPDLSAYYTQFRTGEVDVAIGEGILANFYQDAKKIPGRTIVPVPSTNIEVLMPNLELPVLADKAVREALYGAIDKQSIIDTIYYGLPTPTESVTPKENWAFNPNLPKQIYDVARSNKILEDAGWVRSGSGVRQKGGVPLEFSMSTTTGNALREQVQQVLMQDWQQMGVSLKINNMAAAVIWGEFYVRSKFQCLMVGTAFTTGGADPDPATRFDSHSIPVKGGSGGNYMQYQNPELDALLKDGQLNFDRDKRKAIYWRVQEIIRQDLPVLPIYQYAPVHGYKDGLVGFKPNVNVRSNSWNMNTWYWAKPA
jgi:peptide/nickel transport system substrate-binding protein